MEVEAHLSNEGVFSRAKGKKCILHIGMHKTGSSSIQQSLHHNLRDGNFKYIDLNEPNHSAALELLFRKDPNKNPQIAVLNLTDEEMQKRKSNIWQKIIYQVSQVGDATYIFSAESLVSLSEDELVLMYDSLSQMFSKIIVVAYIRPPKGFIKSAFQQKLKGVHISSLGEPLPTYRWRFEKFDNVFGKDNVLFWKFEPKEFPEGDVVLDFCEKLQIRFPKEKTIKVNESLSLEAVSLLYVYRKFGPPYGTGAAANKKMKTIVDALTSIGSSKFELKKEFISYILEKDGEDIDWMEKRLGSALTESEEADACYAIDKEEDLIEIAYQSVYLLNEGAYQKINPPIHKSQDVKEVVQGIHRFYESKEK